MDARSIMSSIDSKWLYLQFLRPLVWNHRCLTEDYRDDTFSKTTLRILSNLVFSVVGSSLSSSNPLNIILTFKTFLHYPRDSSTYLINLYLTNFLSLGKNPYPQHFSEIYVMAEISFPDAHYLKVKYLSCGLESPLAKYSVLLLWILLKFAISKV